MRLRPTTVFAWRNHLRKPHRSHRHTPRAPGSAALAAQAEADLENATATLRRATELFRQSVESAAQFDRARTGFALARVAQAKAKVGRTEVRRAACDAKRTKRDLKTFELRLRCDNRDRSLAVGVTAHVRLPCGD
jgi:multidrug resistance efflux pump